MTPKYHLGDIVVFRGLDSLPERQAVIVQVSKFPLGEWEYTVEGTLNGGLEESEIVKEEEILYAIHCPHVVKTLAADDAQATESIGTPPELQEVIDRMRAKAKQHNFFGFGSLEAMNAFLEALPSKVTPETLEAIRVLKPRETAESYTVFMQIDDRIYLGESAPSSKGARGEEGEGVWIAATEGGKQCRINANVHISKTGSAEALFKQLDPEGKLNFIRASKAMLPYFKEHGLYGSQVVLEWLSDNATSGGAWDGCAQIADPRESVVHRATEAWGVRALRDVTDECS